MEQSGIQSLEWFGSQSILVVKKGSMSWYACKPSGHG